MPFGKSISRPTLFALLCGAAAMLGVSAPAHAGTGCNGVINIFVWGCAPWDNNNGERYPYYRKRQATVPANQSQIVTRDGARMVLYRGQYYPVVSTDGAGLVGQDGASIRVWVGN